MKNIGVVIQRRTSDIYGTQHFKVGWYSWTFWKSLHWKHQIADAFTKCLKVGRAAKKHLTKMEPKTISFNAAPKTTLVLQQSRKELVCNFWIHRVWCE